jgi:hypothetical protein
VASVGRTDFSGSETPEAFGRAEAGLTVTMPSISKPRCSDGRISSGRDNESGESAPCGLDPAHVGSAEGVGERFASSAGSQKC